MVAARKRSPASMPAPRARAATNVVKRTAIEGGPLVEGRTAPRVRVAQRAWLCSEEDRKSVV